VATYFAVINASDEAAVWGINAWMLRDRLRVSHSLGYGRHELLKDAVNLKHIELANGILRQDPATHSGRGVIPLEAKRLTERASRQQGLFLMPTDLEAGFMENLELGLGVQIPPDEETPGTSVESLISMDPFDGSWDTALVVKLRLPRSVHSEALANLGSMGINSESLFPGLDGMARSLVQSVLRGS